jgi:hypothetical protein
MDVANGHQMNSTLVKILVKVVYNMEYYGDNNSKIKDSITNAINSFVQML